MTNDQIVQAIQHAYETLPIKPIRWTYLRFDRAWPCAISGELFCCGLTALYFDFNPAAINSIDNDCICLLIGWFNSEFSRDWFTGFQQAFDKFPPIFNSDEYNEGYKLGKQVADLVFKE